MREAMSLQSVATAFAMLLVIALAAPAATQTKQVRESLERGDLASAVGGFRHTVRFPNVAERLAACRRLDELARAADDQRLSGNAWKHAVTLLDDPVPKNDEPERAELRVRCGTALARNLGTRRDAVRDDGFVASVLLAIRAMNANGPIGDPIVADLAARALPALVDKQRYRQAVQLGEQALGSETDKRKISDLHVQIGFALLGLRKTEDAMPHLRTALQADPTDPELVHSIVSGLPKKFADDAYAMLLPVVRSKPGKQLLVPWQDCLRETYVMLDSLGSKRDPGRRYWEGQTTRRRLPRIWRSRIWTEGYRVWLPDNARPGKQYEGGHSIEAALPLSEGWRRANPPADLVRWRNHAICFRRSGSATTLVLYWFGPNQAYWYGVTPREKGVTGKTASGSSRGAIANIVSRVCYGDDAKRRGIKFNKTRPLPLKLGVKGTRKAWESDGRIYDETFFSVGQVTVEVLLCIQETELERLRPEIEWMYRNIRAH